jgi:pimeloyl-ACP methyl ester carboxylesterase
MLRRLAVLVLATSLAASCGDDLNLLTEPNGSAPTNPETLPSPIATVDCPNELQRGLLCGVVEVALDPQLPGETTEVSIAVAPGREPATFPAVAVLQGGPGGASSQLAEWLPVQPFTQVFIDQRGTGFSGNSLNCQELDDAVENSLGLPFDEANELADQLLSQCATRLADDPLLAATTTANLAADVTHVMATLGYQQWLVYGVSYGSTIALEMMRRPPAGMVGAVLDGVYPPNVDQMASVPVTGEASLAALNDACQASATCPTDRDLMTLLDEGFRLLDRSPVTRTVPYVGAGTESVEVVIDAEWLAFTVFLSLYNETSVAYLPAVLDGVAQLDEAALDWVAWFGALMNVENTLSNDEGTYYAVDCQDYALLGDPPDVTGVLGDTLATVMATRDCEPWGVAERTTLTDPVTSDVPALLLSGALDPITPTTLAELAAEGLTRATLVEQAGRGHGIWIDNACIQSIVESFVADVTAPLDTSCADEPVSINWERP